MTNLEMIESALRDINVISEVDSASAEQGSHGLRKLNQMLEAWKENDIDFGWFSQSVTTATAPIPDWAELGVSSALSIVLAPKYGATVSQELAVIADSAVSMIKRKSISEKLEKNDMSHMPRGSGHFGYGYDIVSDS
jgi:hypothetical protein